MILYTTNLSIIATIAKKDSITSMVNIIITCLNTKNVLTIGKRISIKFAPFSLKLI